MLMLCIHVQTSQMKHGLSVVADLTKGDAEMQRAVRETIDAFGGLDIIVNRWAASPFDCWECHARRVTEALKQMLLIKPRMPSGLHTSSLAGLSACMLPYPVGDLQSDQDIPLR